MRCQEIETGQVPPGRIIEFNSVLLAALVEQLGALPQIYPIVADRRQEIKAALADALGQGDMVIINAGSSAGTEDHTARVIAELGEGIGARGDHDAGQAHDFRGSPG